MALGVILPLSAKAQFGPGAAKQVGLPNAPLEQLLVNIVNFVLILAGVLALGFLVYGGFRYIYSQGEERDVEAAKDTITYSVIGLIVIGVAAAIINFVARAVLGG